MGTATQPPARPQSGGETKPPRSSDREGETDGDGDATRGQPPSPKATCRPGAVTRSQMSQLASPCPCQPWGRARRRGKGQGTAVPRVTGSCFPRRWMGRVRPRILEARGSATAPPQRPRVPSCPPGTWRAVGCAERVPAPGAMRCHARGDPPGDDWSLLSTRLAGVGRRLRIWREGTESGPTAAPQIPPHPASPVPETSPGPVLVSPSGLASGRRWPRGDAGRRALPRTQVAFKSTSPPSPGRG